MRKLLVSTAILLAGVPALADPTFRGSSSASNDSDARTSAALPVRAAGTGATDEKSPFARLREYAGKHPRAILADPALREALKQVAGRYFPHLERNLGTASGAVVTAAGSLEAAGCRHHECTVEEAQILIEPTGVLHVLVLSGGDKLLHLTNDDSPDDVLPDALRRFAQRFPSAKRVRVDR